MLVECDAALIIGSDSAAYMPSKLYPYILAKRPMLAVLHRESPAVGVVRDTEAAELLTFESASPVRDNEGDVSIVNRLLEANGKAPATKWRRSALHRERNDSAPVRSFQSCHQQTGAVARVKLGILASHPIQYQAPWFRELAKRCDLEVFFAHRPSEADQGVGFGTGFSWDVDLLGGYKHHFLRNVAIKPGSQSYGGCDTPEIAERIRNGNFDTIIVSGWNLKTYWQAIRACRRNKVPVWVRGDSTLRRTQSMAVKVGKRLLYPMILRQFDGFLSVGLRNREYLRHFKVAEEKIHFVPHCVDNEWFASRATAEARSRLRGAWGAGERSCVGLYVGKLTPFKTSRGRTCGAWVDHVHQTFYLCSSVPENSSRFFDAKLHRQVFPYDSRAFAIRQNYPSTTQPQMFWSYLPKAKHGVWL